VVLTGLEDPFIPSPYTIENDSNFVVKFLSRYLVGTTSPRAGVRSCFKTLYEVNAYRQQAVLTVCLWHTRSSLLTFATTG